MAREHDLLRVLDETLSHLKHVWQSSSTMIASSVAKRSKTMHSSTETHKTMHSSTEIRTQV